MIHLSNQEKPSKFTKRTMLQLHEKLKSENIGFLPLLPYKAKKAEQFAKQHGLEKIETDTLENVVINIKFAKDGAYILTYIGQDHMLHTVSVPGKTLHKSAKELGLKLFQYSEQELKRIRTSIQYRLKNASQVEKQRLLLRTTDTIANIPVDPIELKKALNDLMWYRPEKDGLPIQWEIADTKCRNIGNNIASCGITILDYIQARYAYILLSDFQKNRSYITAENKSKIYTSICDKNHALYHDNWTDSRLKPNEDSPIEEPSKNAYDILTKINQPAFERTPENKNTKTFDRIRIFLGIRSQNTCEHRKELIQEYKPDIIKIAMLKIEASKRFQHYGIPINFIRPTRMTVTACDEIELVFELKAI